MAAAERKRADAIKGLEQFETVVRHGGDQQRQSEQDRKEHRQQDGIGGPADLQRQRHVIGRSIDMEDGDPAIQPRMIARSGPRRSGRPKRSPRQ
jgi:hypothetical protein